jgi:AmiR/NasT family two-component response regulator
LNIYSESIGAFAASDLVLVQLFASEAALILSSSLSSASAIVLTRRVQEALVARRVIAQAEGVIIEREGIAAEEAFTIIREISITSGRTLRDEADVIVRSATTQTEAGDGRSGRDG